MPKQAWIAVKVPTIQRAEDPCLWFQNLLQALNKMHSLCPRQGADSSYCAISCPVCRAGTPMIQTCTSKGSGLHRDVYVSALSHCTRDVRSFFSCCRETNPPLLFLAYFKSLTGIRRIQVKITGVTAASLTGNVFLQCKEARARNTFMITTWTTLKGKKNASSFSFLYHNEHISKYFKHILKAMWLWVQSSSSLQGKLPYSFLPSAETKLLFISTYMVF